MKEKASINEVTYQVRGAIFDVYNELGLGLLESIYQEAMIVELRRRGLKVEKEVLVNVEYKGVKLPSYFRLDLVVEDVVVLELKSVENLTEVHFKQLVNYLKLTKKPVGYLVNFNTTNLSKNVKRIVNEFKE